MDSHHVDEGGKKMKRSMVLWATLAALSAIVLAGPAIAGKASGQGGGNEGEPPYGLKVEGDAAGTKLYGVIEVEYFGDPGGALPDGGNCAHVQAVARLRKGNGLKTFYADADRISYFAPASLRCGSMLSVTNPALLQEAIIGAFRDLVVGGTSTNPGFFPADPSLNLYLRGVSDLGVSKVDVPGVGTTNIFNLLDVEIAVH
jgi:hypothetical protein